MKMHLTEADNGRSIDLHVGSKLEIVLSGNLTTGYQWDVASDTSDVLHLQDEPQAKPVNKTVGGESKIHLTFDVIAAGEAALKLIYHRPFEKNVPPIQTFEVFVTAK